MGQFLLLPPLLFHLIKYLRIFHLCTCDYVYSRDGINDSLRTSYSVLFVPSTIIACLILSLNPTNSYSTFFPIKLKLNTSSNPNPVKISLTALNNNVRSLFLPRVLDQGNVGCRLKTPYPTTASSTMSI